MDRVFDTNVQLLKYKVLREVIRRAYEGNLSEVYVDLPKIISPGPRSEIRCCVYKERAIVQERIKLAMGGDKDNPNVIEVIDIACDECPVSGLYVTPACRGCIVHNCAKVCPRGAITIINKKAVVDKEKCIECGKCTKACPYGAIIAHKRPCITSCKANALSMNEQGKAKIDNDKCVSCGACVYQCPFGAIMDKSFILDVINILKGSENNKKYKVYAVIAPAIVSQFKYAHIEQVVTGIIQLGFHQVVEAAMGADITLFKEAEEFAEKQLMTTSCCPSFVAFIEKNFPELVKHISGSVSPMIEVAQLIKRGDPTAKVIFIGPCASKKKEFRLAKTGGAIDCVISFEELQAFIDARDIEISTLEDTVLNNASFYGRIFAKSGGIAQGVADVGATMGLTDVRPIVMSGLEQCKMELLKLKVGRSEGNFFEGMACEGGCLNGPLCLSHGAKNVVDVDKYGKAAKEKEITNSVNIYKLSKK
ncbi:MAG: 4Fe-4S dicluster domain-containing protein [Rikenellaceae bacterium]